MQVLKQWLCSAHVLEVCEVRCFELELEVTFEFDSTTKFEVRKSRTSKRIRTYNNEIEPGHKTPTFVQQIPWSV